MPKTVRAEPFQARQCPECKVWIFTDQAPFAEGDRTKTMRDAAHWKREHDTTEPETVNGATVWGFPFMSYNEVPVDAILEDL